MMDHLGKYNLKRLNGALARTHRLLHILNLVAQVGAEVKPTLRIYICSQAIMDLFSKKRKALARADEEDSDDEMELVAEFDMVSDRCIKLIIYKLSLDTG